MHPPAFDVNLRTVKMSRQSKQALEVKFISNAACARLVECPGKPGAALPLSVWLSRLHDAPPAFDFSSELSKWAGSQSKPWMSNSSAMLHVPSL